MFVYFTCILLNPIGAAQTLPTRFVEVAPAIVENKDFVRSAGRDRAVILIHGLTLQPFNQDAARKAELRDWQRSDSALVKKLGKEADVYAFAYGQTTTADDIPDAGDLGAWVEKLQKLGYKDIVLIGHSAGGVVAREFVEDNPDSAVTKVIQVCTPNEGSPLAKIHAVRPDQMDFLQSLSKSGRREMSRARSDKHIPEKVEFACVAGSLSFLGDGVVACRSQWSEDLQKQGVPVYPVSTVHWHVMQSRKAIDKLAEVVHEAQPRWDAKKVAAVKKELIGK